MMRCDRPPTAYYARLYGLTHKQLRYMLDPHDLTDRELENILDPAEDPPDAPRTKDFPGETFRVLKERETKQYGEYKTKVKPRWNPQTQCDRLKRPCTGSGSLRWQRMKRVNLRRL
jgi:hypothetical protein